MIEQLSAPTWLDEEEFDNLCHTYRTWPAQDQAGVVARFEELKAFIRSRIDYDA